MEADEIVSSVTVLVPALNERVHIQRCVQSAAPLGRVIVIDGGSTDGTQEIAAAAGADVVEHPWSGYAEQKNWALDTLSVATPWVLFLDADEVVTDAGREEIGRVTKRHAAAGYTIPRAYVFLGRPLRHAWWYPDRQLRLFRTGGGRFEPRSVHEHLVVAGRVDGLEEPLLHENLKGVAAFIDRHNRYSTLEAGEMIDPSPAREVGALTGSSLARRRWLKQEIWYRLPCRPMIRFVWLYVVRRGFLDGRRGLIFCQLMAAHEVFINAKLLERRDEGAR